MSASYQNRRVEPNSCTIKLGRNHHPKLFEMKKTARKILRSANIKDWHLSDSDHNHYEAKLVPKGRNAGNNCVLVKSKTKSVRGYGHFTQVCLVDEYRGKRIRMTAWAKSKLPESSIARLELCIYGKWGWWCKWNGTFDNLGDHPITGKTDWKQYALVVDVLEDAIGMSFGLLLCGSGKVWLDEFQFEVVDKKTPLTGLNSKPENLNFQDSLSTAPT